MMEREDGLKSFPIWLIGDSNPQQWEKDLNKPLDTRHPIRHNIWTSVLDVIQDRVFRELRIRVDSSSIFIRNAVYLSKHKPASNVVEWNKETETELKDFQELLNSHKPIFLICFGAFSFEFARRAIGIVEKRRYGSWDTKGLGEEFRQRMEKFNPHEINIIPLLHRSISGGKFIQSHEGFCGKPKANYFNEVGNSIAEKLVLYKTVLDVWL